MFVKRYSERFHRLALIGLLMTLATTHAENGNVADPLQPQSGSSSLSSANNEDFMPSKSIQKDLTNLRLTLMRPSTSAEHDEFSDDILNSIKNRLWMMRPMMQPRPLYLSRKRSCMINAGLSNNCDFRDFISASNARRIWESQASPGKRSIPIRSLLSSSLSSPKTTTKVNPMAAKFLTKQPWKSSASFDSITDDGQQPQMVNSGEEQSNNIELRPQSSSPWNERLVKRMECLSGLPGGDCENSFLGGESLGQDFLRPGGRNPGRR